MTPQEMRALYDYNAWANHRSMDAASKLTTEQFVQPMGSSFGSVRDTLAHIYGGEWIWLERFQRRSPASLPDVTQFEGHASLQERWNEHESRLLGFWRGMKEAARQARAENRIVGLVPTMGALHAGHLSLIERARRECSPVIASIFVNPKQFSPNEDFSKYPRTFESDSEKLQSAGVDSLFAPESAEIYPNGFSTYVNVDGLSERLEGRSRPGHFRGVTTVVMKLLQLVQPNFAYFGRKDAQQSRLITQMARDLNLDTEIVVCPPVREPDGLALSSRNVYLNAEERKAATVLYRALDAARAELIVGARDALRLQP